MFAPYLSRIRLAIVVLAELLMCVACAQDYSLPEWHQEKAFGRLLCKQGFPYANTFRVDIPEQYLGKTKGVFICNVDGEQLQWAELKVAGKLESVVVTIPFHSRTERERFKLDERYPVLVYLLEAEAESSQPTSGLASLRHERLDITAPPQTAADFLAYRRKMGDWRVDRVFDLRDLKGMEDHFFRGNRRRWRGRHLAHFQVSFIWRIPEDREVELRVDQKETGSWYAFMDGQAISDWWEAAVNPNEVPEKSRFMLHAGLHRFDWFGIISHDESVAAPQFRQRVVGAEWGDWGIVSSAEIWPESVSQSVLVQEKEDPFAFGLYARPRGHLYFQGTSTALTNWDARPVIVGEGEDLPKVNLRVNDEPWPSRGIKVLPVQSWLTFDASLAKQPERRLRYHTAPVFTGSMEIKRVRLHITDGPWFVPRQGNPHDRHSLGYTIETNDYDLEDLQEHGLIRRTEFNAAGKELQRWESDISLMPQEWSIPIDDLHAQTHYFELALIAGGVPIAPETSIQIVTPDMASGLSMSAGLLRHGEKVALLLPEKWNTVENR